MGEEHFKRLLKKYADGRQLCNCGEAYYTNCGEGIAPDGKGGREYRSDLPACQHGCSANQIMAKYEIAERVAKELGEI